MPIVYSSVVDSPIEEVHAWHTRPGALARLSPPWQPVKIVREAALSLERKRLLSVVLLPTPRGLVLAQPSRR